MKIANRFIFFVLLFLPNFVFGFSITDLHTDGGYRVLKEGISNNQALNQVDSDKLLAIGDIFSLMNRLASVDPQVEAKPDHYALRAIGYAAQGRPASAKSELKVAVEGNANERYLAYAEAMLLRLDKKHVEAIRVCQKAISYQETHPYPWNILGRIYLDQNDYNKAAESFEKAISLNSGIVPAYLNLGATYYYNSQYERSADIFRKAASINSVEASAYYGLALALEKLNRYPDSISALHKFLNLTNNQIDDLEYMANLQIAGEDYSGLLKTGQLMANKGEGKGILFQAKAYLHLGEISNAEAALTPLKEKNAEKEFLLGLISMVQGNFSGALKNIELALELEPKHFGAFAGRIVLKNLLDGNLSETEKEWAGAENLNRLIAYLSGKYHLKKLEFSVAEKNLKRSEGLIGGFGISGVDISELQKLTDKDGQKNEALGVFYYFLKLRQNAREALMKATERVPGEPFSNYWLAQTYLDQGDRNNGQKYLEASVNHVEFFPSLYSLAELHILKGDRKEAKNYYGRALKQKEDIGIYIKLGLLGEQENNIDLAEKMYKKVVENSPELFLGYNQLAWLFAKRGMKLDDALNLAKKANNLQPGNASVLDTMGWIYFQKKDYQLAEKYLSQAAKVGVNDPTILYHLGAVYRKLGNKEMANKFLKSALAISGTFEEASHARELLD